MARARMERAVVAAMVGGSVMALVGSIVAGAAPPTGPVPPAPVFGVNFGLTGSGQLGDPNDLAVAANGTVYVADMSNDRVVAYEGATGAFVRAFGAGGPAPSTLDRPTGIAVDATGDVWVADRYHHQIKRFSATGVWEATLGSGTQGSGNDQLSSPFDVAVAGGEVFVADRANGRVQVLTPDGVYLRTIGGTVGPSDLLSPESIDIRRDGTVFVRDGTRVAVFDREGVYQGAIKDWPGPDAGSLGSPDHLDVDNAGHLHVTERFIEDVLVFGGEGHLLSRWDLPALRRPEAVAVGGGRAYVLNAPLDEQAYVARLELCPTASFTDLPRSSAFFDAVCWAVSTGVVQGYADGGFHPTDAVSRQAAAAFLWRVAGSPAGPFPDPGFSDVPVGHPFRTAIAWLKASGITGGYADGTFRPSAPVSRQAMASYLYDLVESTVEPEAASFSDVPTGHPFFNPIGWLAATGISTGYPDGTFRPTAPVSRQAMVQFLAEIDGRFLHQPA